MIRQHERISHESRRIENRIKGMKAANGVYLFGWRITKAVSHNNVIETPDTITIIEDGNQYTYTNLDL